MIKGYSHQAGVSLYLCFSNLFVKEIEIKHELSQVKNIVATVLEIQKMIK